MHKHILLVEDDFLMRKSLSIGLERAGYQAWTAASGEEALDLIRTRVPDLILLDLGLPGMDGLELLRHIRRQGSDVPVIVVTAQRRDLDEILGLELGADDYVTKPFDMDVLLAHIRSVLRRTAWRTKPPKRPMLTVGDISIDLAGREVHINEVAISLAPKEFDLLSILARHPDKVLAIDELLSTVWGNGWIGASQTLYVHIRWLREKIEVDPAHPRRLLTVRGIGYKLVPMEG